MSRPRRFPRVPIARRYHMQWGGMKFGPPIGVTTEQLEAGIRMMQKEIAALPLAVTTELWNAHANDLRDRRRSAP